MAAPSATNVGPTPEPEPSMSTKDASGPARVLDLGPDLSLVLEETALLVRDRRASKSSRICGFSLSSNTPAERRIPLYNILWIEVSKENTLVIDYAAETSKTRLTAAKLTFPLESPPPTPADIEPGDTSAKSHPAPTAAATATTPAPAPATAATAAATSFAATVLAQAYDRAKPAKRALVLVNPRAGPGGADGIWQRQVRPLFEAARMRLEVVRTAYAGQARELAAGDALLGGAGDGDPRFDVLVACSGDGLPHELWNGLAERRDAGVVLRKVAVAHIPCGSGNAMSCNLYGTHRPSLAALAVVKGVETPLDLVSVTQEVRNEEEGTTEVRRMLSFLSQSLGVIAEVDLATEHLRFLGEQRFALGFIKVVLLQKKVYPIDLAVKVEIEKDDVKGHYRLQQSRGDLGAAEAGPDGAGKEASPFAGGGESGTTTPATEEGQSQGSSGLVGLPPLRYGTVADKLPAGWEMVPHDKLGNFYCGNMAYMAPNANFFQAALANDGLMDLVTIDGDISAAKSFELQKFVGTGHFFDSPLVGYRKVVAYRVVPRQDSGYISIDGERVPFAPFQAEVHRGLGLVLSRNGKFEQPGPRGWEDVTVAERIMA